jgi:hypothetical protein
MGDSIAYYVWKIKNMNNPTHFCTFLVIAFDYTLFVAIKSPIVMALEEVGAFNKLENEQIQKPVPSGMRRRELSVIETTFGGG